MFVHRSFPINVVPFFLYCLFENPEVDTITYTVIIPFIKHPVEVIFQERRIFFPKSILYLNICGYNGYWVEYLCQYVYCLDLHFSSTIFQTNSLHRGYRRRTPPLWGFCALFVGHMCLRFKYLL